MLQPCAAATRVTETYNLRSVKQALPYRAARNGRIHKTSFHACDVTDLRHRAGGGWRDAVPLTVCLELKARRVRSEEVANRYATKFMPQSRLEAVWAPLRSIDGSGVAFGAATR